MGTEPPERFRSARRTLEELPFCDILEDLFVQNDWWVLKVAITNETHVNIPKRTEWYVFLPGNYPFGEISLYPSKTNSITETYPHQAYNCHGRKEVAWLTGKPCLSSSLRTLGRRQYDVEPMSVEMRLAWHLNRLKAWLEEADRGTLIKEGDPFELPEYPNTLRTESLGFIGSRGRIGALEEESWDKFGCATMCRILGKNNTHVWIPVAFKDFRGTNISERVVKELYGCEEDDLFAIWVRVTNVPHVSPWRGIRTYCELRKFLKDEHIDLDELLQQFSRNVRDGKRHIFLIGFPVPEKFESDCGSWYWLAILLPILAHGRINGFRESAHSYLLYDKTSVLADDSEIQWVKSRSWHPNDILSRGSFEANLATKKVLVIGLGAIGAFLAELLVRAGVKHIVLIDDDRLEIGNLTRHTLTIREIGELKVSALKRRLQIIEPNVTVEALPYSFVDANSKSRYEIVSSDLIVDCTGDDSLLYDLSKPQFGVSKMFVSISVGFGAKQVFVFCAKEAAFPADEFKNAINPFLEKEKNAIAGSELPRDGIGCWHPAFPARCDDVWMMTSAAVKIVEAFVQGNERVYGLTVLRQKIIDGISCGIERVYSP